MVDKVTQILLVLRRSRGKEGKALLGHFICLAMVVSTDLLVHPTAQLVPALGCSEIPNIFHKHWESLNLSKPVPRFGFSKPQHALSEPGAVFNEGMRSCLVSWVSQVEMSLSKDRELCHPHPG